MHHAEDTKGNPFWKKEIDHDSYVEGLKDGIQCERDGVVEKEFNLSNERKKLIEEHLTSWRWLKRKGFRDAEELGDCIFVEKFLEELEKQDKEFIKETIEDLKYNNLTKEECLVRLQTRAGADLI